MYTKTKLVFGANEAEGEATLPFSLIAAGTTNATLVKAGAGIVTNIVAMNVAAAVRYLKFYDIPFKPTAGQGIPCRRYPIPAATTGAGFIIQPPAPLKFFYGIAFTMTTGVADTDTAALTANDVILTLEYL